MTTPAWADAWLKLRVSDDPAVLLATITHPALDTVRLVRDVNDLVSRGETFKASWFEIDWVNDDGNAPRVQFSIPNVNPREVGQRYLWQSTRPEVTLEVVALSLPDDPIGRVARLEMTDLQVDAAVVQGTLLGKDHSAEPLGTIHILPARFPAFFRRQRKL